MSDHFTTEANKEKEIKCEKYRLVSKESEEYIPDDEGNDHETG